MREQEYRAKDKKVNRMSRDGLVEDNLATGSRENISSRVKEADFRKADTDISYGRPAIRAELERHKENHVHGGRAVSEGSKEARAAPVTDKNDREEDTEEKQPEQERVIPDNVSSRGTVRPIFAQEKAKESFHKKKHYKKRNARQNRLQFDKEEQEKPQGRTEECVKADAVKAASPEGTADTFIPSSKLQHMEQKKEKTVSKLEHARKKQPKKRSLRMQRVYDEEKQKAGHKLYFEETPKAPKRDGVAKRATKRAAISAANQAHGKISQVEKENSGVEATHKSEKLSESAVRSVRSHKYNVQKRQQSKINRLEKKVYKGSTSYQYRKYLEEHPEMKKKALNKLIQKQRIKREYQKAYKAGKTAGSSAKHTAEIGGKVARKLQEILAKNKAVLGAVLVIGVLLIFIMAGFSSCSMMLSDTIGTTILSSWVSKPAEIDKADLEFTRLEMELQNTVDSVESDYPDYDEYRYNVGSIGHDPFTLISYLSAKYEEFTYAEAASEISSIFNEMYTFTTTEVVETRTRTETRTGTDSITGESYTYEVEVEYDYYILEVKLSVKTLETIAAERLDTEKAEFYSAYTESKGRLQQLGTPLNLYWYSYVSSYYGYRKNPTTGAEQLHRGVDIAVPEGTEVLAGHTGTVTTATYDSEYGNYVVITDTKGYTSKYAHMSSLNVSAGQSVTIGDKIGETGNTGSSTGSHLHIEVMYGGEYYNPLFYFDVGTGTLYGEVPGGNVTPPDSYDDATVAALIAEAERYLGMPYTFGGTPPTSFDCSAFVCWAFTNSGVHDLSRTTAQGIYDQCTPVAASEAKAGDIIFFTGTYNAGRPVTHVGIYCGNGVMLHCGDPIQYASINTSYWQSHFYGFGRLN